MSTVGYQHCLFCSSTQCKHIHSPVLNLVAYRREGLGEVPGAVISLSNTEISMSSSLQQQDGADPMDLLSASKMGALPGGSAIVFMVSLSSLNLEVELELSQVTPTSVNAAVDCHMSVLLVAAFGMLAMLLQSHGALGHT